MKQQIVKHLFAIALLSSTICCVSSRAATEPTATKASATQEAKKADAANIEYSKIIEDYSLEASAKGKYAPSEAIFIDVTLKNVGEDGAINRCDNPLRDYEITVISPDGKATPMTLYGLQESQQSSFFNRVIASPFAANAEDKDKIQLNRRFDMTLSGVYTVSLNRYVYRRHSPLFIDAGEYNGFKMQKANTVKVLSNVVKITVQ